MYDPIDTLFDELRGQRPPVPFSPAEAVRRRGRRRAHRHAASAGAAVLAVTGLGAGALAVTGGEPEPPPLGAGAPSAPVSATPGPTRSVPALAEIPQRWLLTAGDLPPDRRWTETTNELFESDPPWFWGNLCGDYRGKDYRSLRLRLDLATVSWRRTDGPDGTRLDQVVELFDRAQSSAGNLDDVRLVTGRCSRPPTAGADGAAGASFEVVGEDFAGDEALLIEMAQYYFDRGTVAPEPERRFAAVIRVGRVVTTVISGDDRLLREVAPTAAARLGG